MATSGGGNNQGRGRGARGRRFRGPLVLKGVGVDERDRIEVPWWLSGACPDPNVVAEFLEQRLSPPQHQRMLDHIKDCESCWDLFASADALDLSGGEVPTETSASASAHEPPAADLPPTEAEPRPPVEPKRVASTPRPPRSARLASRIALDVAIAGLALALGTSLATRDPRVLLTATVPTERLFAPRFTGGIPWSPPAPRVRSAAVEGGRDLTRGMVSYLAAAELRAERDRAPGGTELGAMGAAQVLGGRVEPGVETLTRAVATEPESPELLSDYGAALLARAEGATDLDFDEEPRPGREERDADLPAALEAIERALEKSPRMPEALFNRALVLERLHLSATAKKAWQRYLEVDGGSAWAKEGRRRLAAIELPVIADAAQLRAEIATAAFGSDPAALAVLVHDQRHLARRTIEEQLLPEWGEAFFAGDLSAASARLSAARSIAEEWERQTTDESLLMAVVEVEAASGVLRDRLARGHRSFGEATRAFAVFDIAATKAAVDRALGAFPAESSAVPWARVLRLITLYYESANVEVAAQPILVDPATDPASRGHALSLVGLWQVKHGDGVRALATFRNALAAYGKVEEREPAIWVRQMVGETYGYMGASGLGWKYRRAAIRNVGLLTDNGRAFTVVFASALLAFAEQHPRAAASFIDEALATPGEREPYEAFQAFLWRSRIRHSLGDVRGANDDFARANAWFSRLGPMEGRWLAPELNAMRGLLARDPHAAIAALSRAVEQFGATGDLYRIPGVLLARAQAHVRAGQVADADKDLRRAALLNEQQRATGAHPSAAAPLDQLDRLFAERVKLALQGGRPDDAFAVAEAGRARALRVVGPVNDGAVSRQAEPLQIAELRARLEPGTTMLFFSVLPDRVLRWRVEQDRSSLATLGLSPKDLARMASSFEADLQAGVWTATTRELAMSLYAALISPAPRGAGPVVLIPDGELHRLPFAALIDPATGRFLVEDSAVAVAPSATSYVEGRDRYLRLGVAPPRDALVVGDPLVSATLFPGMAPLSGARSEARMVAALYPDRQLLLGGAATRTAFVGSLDRRQVVHFAGHAITNRTNPERSSLPLAEDGGADGSVLFGTEIAALDLSHTQVVVLSGCETAGGVLLEGEGPVSLARAFLAAGVPSVVASLWPIPDGPSVPLVTAFHRGLRHGEPPAAALRSAQLAALHSGRRDRRSPSVWAAFQAFGG